MKLKTTAVMLTSIASLATTANAAVVLGDIIAIDFGATVAATSNYNHSTQATNTGDVADLIRLSDGAATGVSLTMTGVSQNNVNNVASSDGLGNTTDTTIYVDGILANQNNGASGNPDTLTLTFAGLNDTLTYDLEGGLARADTQNNISNWTSVWSADGQSAASDGFDTGYVSFAGLKSTGGSLVLTIVSDNQYAGISQLELTAVPEPSSTALLGLGGLALILRRRK